MAKGSTFSADFLKLILNAVAIANLADNAASGPLTILYVGLHTADPSAGNQSTSETAYTGYARVAVARTSGGWTIVGASASPNANIDFPACTASPGAACTHASVGTASSGAGKLLWSGAITPNIQPAVALIPRIGTGSTIAEG